MRPTVPSAPRPTLLSRSRKHEALAAHSTFGLLAGFVLVILSGLFGTLAGSRSFAIIFAWIVWWALLIIGLTPALGRAWCAICLLPAPPQKYVAAE
jgi:hypothetical protein